MGPPTSRSFAGSRPDLRSARVAASVERISIDGTGLKSLAGIERFVGLREIGFERARTDELSPLVPMSGQLRQLTVSFPATRTDFASLVRLHQLETLWLWFLDREDVDAARATPFDRCSELRRLFLLTGPYPGPEMPLDWLPGLKHLESLHLGGFGVRAQDTEMLCTEGARLKELSFRAANSEQANRIVDALGPEVVDLWDSPGVAHGIIAESDDYFFVTLSFPRADSGTEQDEMAQRLLRTKWRDLAAVTEYEQGGDEVVFRSESRGVLEELVRRAHREGVV
jgi:hypothetical protein